MSYNYGATMSTYTILAIDDSKKILDIIKYFLENEGYNVKAVGDPFEGIQVAQQGGIDLILLDIMMPGMDGYTVFDNLRIPGQAVLEAAAPEGRERSAPPDQDRAGGQVHAP